MFGLVVIIFAIAGMIKGMIGLGLPAVSMGLLSIVMSPMQAAALLVVPSMITNIWQLWAEGQVLSLIQRFWPMLLGIVVGSLWSIFPTLAAQNFQSKILLGAMLALYGIYGLFIKNILNLQAYELWFSPIVGYFGGAMMIATGVVVIPIVPYLQSLQLKRDDLVQALGLAFTVSTLCLALFLFQHNSNALSHDYLWSSFAVLPALMGMWLGMKIRYRISEQKFRQTFFIGLIALGSYMMLF